MNQLKPKVPNFKRNDIATPTVVPVEFNITLSLDPTKVTAQEWFETMATAEKNAAEAYILREAQKDPTGYWATTYFIRLDE